MIYDLRFMISGRAAFCRRSRGVENLREFFGFLKKSLEAFGWQQFGSFGQFDPKPALVGFFEHDRDLVDEVRIGLRPQSNPLIGRHRGSAAGDLISDRFTSRRLRERIHHRQDSHRKVHGPLFELLVRHRDAIPNHKS